MGILLSVWLVAQQSLTAGAFYGAAVAGTGLPPVFIGNQGVSSSAEPITAATRFDLASCTKPFVAAACAVLAAEGKLDLDEPFTKYLPDHCLNATNHGIRVRDLALHVSGFRQLPRRRYFPEQCGGEREFMNDIMQLRPVAPPRKSCSYQCTNYILLGLIAERISGFALPELVKVKVFDPIGMRNARWWPVADDGCVAHVRLHGLWEPGTNDLIGIVHDEAARFAGRPVGNAGIFATLEDVRLFADDLLNRRALPTAAYELMFACGYENDQGTARRSFGFDLSPAGRPEGFSTRAIFHTGFTGQMIIVDPVNRFAGVVLTLRRNGTGLAARKAILAAALADFRSRTRR